MDQHYPAGTILSCPSDTCGLGLYRIVAPATFEDLVIFDDKVLAPLNITIPPYDVWQILACPFLWGTATEGWQSPHARERLALADIFL